MRGAINAVALLLVLCLAGWAAGEEDQMEQDDPLRQEFLQHLNDWRADFELPRLFLNNELMDFAQRRADEMERRLEIALELIPVSSESGKTVAQELEDAGYQVTHWTFDVSQGVTDAKEALSVFVEDAGSRAHMRDSFVMEAGVGFSAEGGRWAVLLARRKIECGNGLVELGEECDDGNTADDCCNSECLIESNCDCYQLDNSPTTVCSAN